MFRSAVRSFVKRELEPNAERHRVQGEVDRETWRIAGEAGFLGFMMPEHLGGGGIEDYRFNVIFGEELARLGFAYASSFGINTDVVSPYLRELCTDDQRERWIPDFCRGQLITAIALTEAAGGSDLASLRTRAQRDGGDWVLNGSKTFITNGGNADLIIVAATRDPELGSRGITLFAVEPDMPGFQRGRNMEKLGQKEAGAAELFFSDLRVPDENVIGNVDEGFKYVMERLAQERLSCAVQAVASADAILTETLGYASVREAFGQAIGTFQYNKFQLAKLHTALSVTRTWVDRCIESRVAGTLSAVDAAMSKYWATEVLGEVVDACLQLHGGFGYMQECAVGRAWVDSRVARIFAGTNEVMLEIIGRSLLQGAGSNA